MHRYLHGAPARAALMASALVLGGCAGLPAPVITPAASDAYVAAFDKAHQAGLTVYDALAPALAPEDAADPYAAVLGPSGLQGESCESRYVVEALQVRCAALAAILAYNEAASAQLAGLDASPYLQIAAQSLSYLSLRPGVLPLAFGAVGEVRRLAGDLATSRQLTRGAPAIRNLIGALRADAPHLYQLERAARAARLRAADNAWLDAMDDVFDAVNGRSSPQSASARAALDRVAQRLAPMLGRETPGYGADSLFVVMKDGGRALTSAEIAALEPTVEAAEKALAGFDAIARDWRDIAEAIRAYDELLGAVDEALSVGGAAKAAAMRDRAGEIALVLNRIRRETRL